MCPHGEMMSIRKSWSELAELDGVRHEEDEEVELQLKEGWQ